MSILASPFQRLASMLVPGLVLSHSTTADLTLYVATTGSDSNDGLTAGAPLLTVNAALAKVPRFIKHNVVVNVAAGTYTEEIEFTGFTVMSRAVSMMIAGTMGAPTLTTGTTTGTISSATAASGSTHQSFTDTGQTWTTNELKGKWVSINGSTTYRVIAANTATAITLTGSGTVTAGQPYAILEPQTIFTSSTSGKYTLSVAGSPAPPGGVMLEVRQCRVTNGGSSFGCVNASNGLILRYCSIYAVANGAVRAEQGIFSCLSSFVSAASNVGPMLLGVNGQCLNVSLSSSYIQGNVSAVAVLNIYAADTLSLSSVWVENLSTSSQPIIEILRCGKTQGQTRGLTILGASGNTSVGLSVGFEDSTRGGYAAVSIDILNVTNCGTAVRAAFGGRFFLTTNAYFTTCTTGYSAIYGGTIRAVGSTTFTSVTNEVSIDGTTMTLATVTAATPLQVVSNAQTFASVARY